MGAETAHQFEALEAQAARILALFRGAGYEPVAPAILQPAQAVLARIGESLRPRIYVFTDQDGEELCLRPDLTIPAARVYIRRHGEATPRARYCYNGPCFRYQAVDAPAGTMPREFRQAGIELFGQDDREKADVEVLGLIHEAVRTSGLNGYQIRLGDLGLFFRLLAELAMPERWRRQLTHHFWRQDAFDALLDRLTGTTASHSPGPLLGLLEQIASLKPRDAETQVAHYIGGQGLTLVGERGLSEITERLHHQARDLREDRLPRETGQIIKDFLDIDAPPRAAGARIADLCDRARIDLGPALEAYYRRLELMSKAGLDLANARFQAEFGRHLEYYTGFVFQIEVPDLGRAGDIAGGGRYDTLLADLGAARAVPAVGGAIHTERLLAAAGGPALSATRKGQA